MRRPPGRLRVECLRAWLAKSFVRSRLLIKFAQPPILLPAGEPVVAELQRHSVIRGIKARNAGVAGGDQNLGAAAPPRQVNQRHSERGRGFRRRHAEGKRQRVRVRCSAPGEPAQAERYDGASHGSSRFGGIIGRSGRARKSCRTVIHDRHPCLHPFQRGSRTWLRRGFGLPAPAIRACVQATQPGGRPHVSAYNVSTYTLACRHCGGHCVFASITGAAAQPTLYQRLGGYNAIQAVVDEAMEKTSPPIGASIRYFKGAPTFSGCAASWRTRSAPGRVDRASIPAAT